MAQIVDLSSLPPPNVVKQIDFETTLRERIGALLALVKDDDARAQLAATLELESEPLTKLLQENVARELLKRQETNEAAQALMLAFAVDEDLDHIAANYEIKRFLLAPADPNANPPTPDVWEANDDLRLRAQQAFEGLSVAGPKGAYIKYARDADARVADASAISPQPCEAVVTILSREGTGSASADLLEIVAAALNDEWIRPIGDRLTVQSARIVFYTIDAALYIYPGPESEPIRQAAVARLQTYIQAQRKLGRDIRRSAITAALHAPGVQRVELASPAADIVLDETEVGYCTDATVSVGGYDE
ncbi:MAG: baseplate J/gp47 family protein [Betaproteobacteria bacterium]|nr:baseplate J/gp47 family protein [Betaproteobacteria bacterium]